MNAEILAIGTELLLGQIANTNAQFLSRELANIGINVFYHSVVGDNENRLENAVNLALQRSDIIITTGGLGPTQDDLTKETIAKALGLPLELHPESLNRIEQYFAHRRKEMAPNNQKQAYLPKGCTAIENNNGTAPGCIIEKNGKIVMMLPGPPSEMIPMVQDSVIPYLQTKSQHIIYSKELKIVGIGESQLECDIKDLIDKQTNPTIAPYAKTGEVLLRVTAKASSVEEAESLLAPMVLELHNRLKEKIYTEDAKTLEEVVIELLKTKNQTLSTAESCTGGMIASTLVNVSGASSVFEQGVVTYSNKAKMSLLGVQQQTLNQFGAVSEETAVEMAKGLLSVSGSDIAIATTGIAGPEGGTPEKPVGLVYIALASKNSVEVEKLYLSGNRQKIRHMTMIKALDLIRKFLI